MANAGLLQFVHRRRRGAELFLLILALVVGIGAYAAVGLGVDGEVPTNIVGYGGWLAALVIIAHVVVRLVEGPRENVQTRKRNRPAKPQP